MKPYSEESNSETYALGRLLASQSLELYERFTSLAKKAENDLLPFAQLPNFTDHGVKHAHNVQENLSNLIPSTMAEPLSPFELFCLLCAALLHDVGMVVLKSPQEKPFQIRIDHYNRSREFVIENNKILSLSEHEAHIIGEICRAHGMPNLNYLESSMFSVRKYGEVRVQLLSALLRLADALDMTSERAPGTISSNRNMPSQSQQHWDIHRCISDVQVCNAPSWDIRIIAFPKKPLDVKLLYELRNMVQNELDSIYPVLRATGIFFKKVELILNHGLSESFTKRYKNPFLLLAPFGSRNARLFAGRDKEIQQMIERILRRNLVVLIGESGVGKTSLIEAGTIPKLKTYGFRVVRFSFQNDPIENLINTLTLTSQNQQGPKALVDVIHNSLSKSKKNTQFLIIGDHLEQMFTIHKSKKARIKFAEHISRVLGSSLDVTFLFCIREDYLPDLYNLSLDIPDLYDRDNTFRLHKLSRNNGREVLKRASEYAFAKLSDKLIERVVDDLCYEGDGVIYPPYLQIVGYRLYGTFAKIRSENSSLNVISEKLYESLGKVEEIVNRYLEGLLDQYPHDDKAVVGQILSTMVTEYYTKKRVKKEDLQQTLLQCHNLDKLLTSLVQHRIVRRSLGEYELIHDFLACRVIEFIEKKKFLSSPARKAVDFIEKKFSKKGLTSGEIAKEAGVSQMHLAFLFRKELGRSINRQLNETRIVKAKELLKSRDRLMGIAKRTGFRSLSAFSRKFKEIEGVSPLEYRNTFITTKLQDRKR